MLFACGQNSVRSPMAASLLQQMFPQGLYVRSAGVKKGELDPFAVAVMAELGQDISTHKPTTFEELDDWEGLEFRPHHHAVARGASQGAGTDPHARRRRRILADATIPPATEGNREQKLQAYREVCDTLLLRIRQRFAKAGAASE